MSQPIMGPPHDFFCECCEYWRKNLESEFVKKNLEVHLAKMREVEEVEPEDYHSSQADGFSNGD